MRGKIRKNWTAIAGISIAAGIVLAVIGVMRGGTPFYTFAYESENGWQFSTSDMIAEPVIMEKTGIESFKNLYVTAEAMDVHVEAGDEYSIAYASAYGKLDLEVNNETLKVTRPERLYLFSWGTVGEGRSGLDQNYVKITVPADVVLKDLKIVSESGDVRLDELTAKQTEVTTESGDVKLELTESEAAYQFVLRTEAGDITLNGEKSGSSYSKSQPDGKMVKVSAEAGDILVETK